jgi:hypothetical protein
MEFRARDTKLKKLGFAGRHEKLIVESRSFGEGTNFLSFAKLGNADMSNQVHSNFGQKKWNKSILFDEFDQE